MTEISVVASMFPPERTPPPAGPVDPAGEQRRDGRGARTLDDELRALEAEHDRLAISSSLTVTTSSRSSRRARTSARRGA